MADNRILFVLPWLPYPLISGGHQAIFNGLRAVVGKYDIHITYDASNGDASQENKDALVGALGSCSIHPYVQHQKNIAESKQSVMHSLLAKYKHIRHFCKSFIKNILGIKTAVRNSSPITPTYHSWLNTLYPFNESFFLFVRELVEKENIDLVQCEMIRNASLAYFLPRRVKRVFVHHELRTVRYELELPSINGEECVKQAYLDYFRMSEVGTLNQYDAVITLSEIDRDKLVNSGVTVPVFPSFAVVNTKLAVNPSSHRYNVLSFIGSCDHSPNIVGLKWFLENVWNQLLAVDQSYTLQVIGQCSSTVRGALSAEYQNIVFTGFIDDLKSVINDTIMIVPITVGSGIRMKILEALTLGCPIVSTSIGAEGLPIVNMENGLLADSPNDFLSAILQLRSRELRKKLIASGQSMIADHFSFSNFKESRISVYSTVLRDE